MYAVLRETTYTPDKPLPESPEFKEFQRQHEGLDGYVGTVVVEVEPGRYQTLTLWRSDEDMAAAREAMRPVVERTVNRLMTSPAKLLGTGRVVVNDLVRD